MSAMVEWSRNRREYVVVVRLTSGEAEGVAGALGMQDGAYEQLMAAAEEARKRQAQLEENRKGLGPMYPN